MKNKVSLMVFLSVIIFIMVIFFMKNSQQATHPLESMDSAKAVNEKINLKENTVVQRDQEVIKNTQTPGEKIMVTAENFEALSTDCMRDSVCEVEGDPWAMYEDLKKEGKHNVTDLYIAFLRKNLSQPEFKERYKNVIRRMIEDFYPSEQIDFQIAAYHNYLGDLESSLKSYLNLEKKSLSNPRLFSSPKLNIANTYYDLKRYKEALRYYRASLDDSKSTNTSDQIESVNFIQERIHSIESRSNTK